MQKYSRSDIENAISADAMTFHKDGNITAKWEYYYRFSKTPEKYAEKIKKALPEAVILDSGDHFHAFVGGSRPGSSQSSYMWVRFKLPRQEKERQ